MSLPISDEKKIRVNVKIDVEVEMTMNYYLKIMEEPEEVKKAIFANYFTHLNNLELNVDVEEKKRVTKVFKLDY